MYSSYKLKLNVQVNFYVKLKENPLFVMTPAELKILL